jgi:hypothetical protein
MFQYCNLEEQLSLAILRNNCPLFVMFCEAKFFLGVVKELASSSEVPYSYRSRSHINSKEKMLGAPQFQGKKLLRAANY